MRPLEQWIWIPEKVYPDKQTTAYAVTQNGTYAVCAFDRCYSFGKAVSEMSLRVSGDTSFRLTVNGEYRIDGPAAAGNDFLCLESVRPTHYAYEVTLDADDAPALSEAFAEGNIVFRAEVRMKSERAFECSKGHGGFMLTAHITFADGTRTVVLTDESWQATVLSAYKSAGEYDGTVPEEAPVPAEIIPNIWHCETAPIPPQTIHHCFPEEPFTVGAGETREVDIPLGAIMGGYISVDCRAEGEVFVRVGTYETDTEILHESCRFTGNGHYEGFGMCSASRLRVTAENRGESDATVCVGYVTVHYPVTGEAVTVVSDDGLNTVMRVCAHTLKICRQTLHLDSTLHCEPLACTGDYYIESLMTAFTYGDLRLAAFDVRRTAELLRYHDGRMFHTSYSLIWVQMLWDVYRFTGESELLSDCADALGLLLSRFESYIGDTGLIETPPDFMFVDWLCPDGIDLHHPPKALGQSVLNLFYYGALRTAASIYTSLGLPAMARKCGSFADTLREAVLSHLWDPERGLFFEGLNTPSPEETLGEWLPRNTEKRYYRRHANILACYFGILPPEDSRALLRRIFGDDSLGEVQPYFMHFWLDAVFRCGLREEQTLELLSLWKAPCRECQLGLVEGFYKPVPTYGFDHSHAWGGTPVYALPLALSGLEMLEPGYRKIKLSPSLLGLAKADVEIPTPFGTVVIDMEAGRETRISVPDGIELITD